LLAIVDLSGSMEAQAFSSTVNGVDQPTAF
jgi:hypothetical protein